MTRGPSREEMDIAREIRKMAKRENLFCQSVRGIDLLERIKLRVKIHLDPKDAARRESLPSKVFCDSVLIPHYRREMLNLIGVSGDTVDRVRGLLARCDEATLKGLRSGEISINKAKEIMRKEERAKQAARGEAAPPRTGEAKAAKAARVAMERMEKIIAGFETAGIITEQFGDPDGAISFMDSQATSGTSGGGGEAGGDRAAGGEADVVAVSKKWLSILSETARGIRKLKREITDGVESWQRKRELREQKQETSSPTKTGRASGNGRR